MDQQIKKLMRKLWSRMIGAWCLMVALFVMGMNDIIPNGTLVGDTKTLYILNIVCIAMTLIGVPLALKLFALNTNSGLRRMNNDEALQSYANWSLVRLVILISAAAYGLVLYFLSGNESTGVLCMCICLLSTLLCIPSYDKTKKYLEERDK